MWCLVGCIEGRLGIVLASRPLLGTIGKCESGGATERRVHREEEGTTDEVTRKRRPPHYVLLAQR
jgi:hypothetical protein